MENAILDQQHDQWVRLSRGGDREAFGRIVRQYQGIVSGLVYGMLGDFHRSEDIAQETFLVAWKKLDELRDVSKLPGWLCGIARNLAKKHLERHPKLPSLTDSEVNDIPELSDDPATRLAREERNRLLWDALENIPEKYRVPLVLYYRNEKSVCDIAAALELSEEALHMRLSRARKYLRKELERQVAGALFSSAPGELFSLAVIAALPGIATLTTTGQAVAATPLAVEPVLAAAVCTSSECGSGNACAATFSLGGFVLSILSIVSIVLFWFCWIGGLIPSLWLSIRNAPSLRARRYLILTSLRLYCLFGAICSFAASLTALDMPFGRLFSGGTGYTTFTLFRDTVCFSVWFLLIATALILLPISIFGYRRVLRENAGLIAPQKMKPLEESSLSFKRLRRSFRLYGSAMLAMFAVTIGTLVSGVYLEMLQGFERWTAGCGLQAWERFLRYFGAQYGLVGLLVLVVFQRMYHGLLKTAKDEESFAAAPAIIDRNTPFRERVFIEWLVSFGLFLAAGFIFLWGEAFISSWIPRSPVSLFEAIVLLLAVTFGGAAINARWPILRWLTNTLVIGFLFASFLLIGLRRVDFMGWNHLPFQEFFDSPRSWPVLWGITVLDAILVFTTLTTMILGVLYLRWKGKKRFFSPRTIKMTDHFVLWGLKKMDRLGNLLMT